MFIDLLMRGKINQLSNQFWATQIKSQFLKAKLGKKVN